MSRVLPFPTPPVDEVALAARKRWENLRAEAALKGIPVYQRADGTFSAGLNCFESLDSLEEFLWRQGGADESAP